MKKSPEQFTLRARLASMRYAINGLLQVIRSEHNARIHMVAAVIAIIAGILLHISRIEWMLVLFCFGLVFASEIINTALEKMIDLVIPQKNEHVKIIKDISAGAVLVSAIIAFITGLIIFIPYLARLL